MRDGARPRLELEEGGRNPLVYVAIGIVVMFFVAVGLFIALAGDRPGTPVEPDTPPFESR